MLNTFLRRVFCTRRPLPQGQVFISGANLTTGTCGKRTDGMVYCDNRAKVPFKTIKALGAQFGYFLDRAGRRAFRSEQF